MTPKEAALNFHENKTQGLGLIQREWDHIQWTQYDIERQRLANTEWYQMAVKDGRIAA